MPFAVTHVLLTIIAVDLYRDYFAKNKKLFSLHTILIAGIGGLLPDIDIPITFFLDFLGYSIDLHGFFTHTIIFGLLFLLPALFIFKKENKWRIYLLVISFGIFFHIFLDWFIGGGAEPGIMFFWPLSTSAYKIHLLAQFSDRALPALDAVILVLWLWHEEHKHKISDFI